ncbi:MAG: hypothetical protein WCF90_01160 [Methanomicrobiales archaeon]
MEEQIFHKIDEIASSVKSGYRIYSHMENQRMCRKAFDVVMENQSSITINKTAILKDLNSCLLRSWEKANGERCRIRSFRISLHWVQRWIRWGLQQDLGQNQKRQMFTNNWTISKNFRISAGFLSARVSEQNTPFCPGYKLPMHIPQ